MPKKVASKSKSKSTKSAKKVVKETEQISDHSDHYSGEDIPEVEEAVVESVAVVEAAVPVVTQSWSSAVAAKYPVDEEVVRIVEPTPLPPDSAANFDREEAAAYEDQMASELQIDQVLKMLIRRGERQFNPALAKGAEKLLRQLNCEQIHPVRSKNSRPRRRNRKKELNGAKE